MWLSHHLLVASSLFTLISALPQLNFHNSVSSESSEENIKYEEDPYKSSRSQSQLLKCESKTERYDIIKKKCLKVNHRNHCGANMIFLPIDEKKGECKCDGSKSSVPLLYNGQTNACYYVYEKAYCKRGEWLQLGFNNEGVCEPNPCLQELTRNRKNGERIGRTVYVQNRCLALGTKCLNGVIAFDPKDLVPKCLKETDLYQFEGEIDGKAIFSVRRLRCSPGYILRIDGGCHLDDVFDF